MGGAESCSGGACDCGRNGGDEMSRANEYIPAPTKLAQEELTEDLPDPVHDIKNPTAADYSEKEAPSNLNEDAASDFAIVIVRDSLEGPGLGLGVDKHPTMLVVEEIFRNGLMAEWNQHHPDRVVGEGDIIVGVDDIFGDAEGMLDAWRKLGEHKIAVKRGKKNGAATG